MKKHTKIPKNQSTKTNLSNKLKLKTQKNIRMTKEIIKWIEVKTQP